MKRQIVVLATGALCGGAAFAEVTRIPLNYNFNGLIHQGETGSPDDPDGFRSISDRAVDLRFGVPASLATSSDPLSALTYEVVTTASVLDIVHLGDRNVVAGGAQAYDDTDGPDGDNVGVSPAWQPVGTSDQTGPQATTFGGILLGADAAIGVLYNASNGGGDFDVTLGFQDGSSAFVTLNAPDWFGAQSPALPGAGVAFQASKGTFAATDQVDAGATDAGPLNVIEAIISAPTLALDQGVDISGRTLISLTFGSPSTTDGYAIYAASVDDGTPVVVCDTDLNNDGSSDVQDLLEYLTFWFAGCP